MKKFLKYILVCFVVVFSCLTTACSNDNDNTNTPNSPNNSTTPNNSINISITNVSQYFDIDVNVTKAKGYLVYYKLTIKLIGNYKLKTNITFTTKSEITYYYTTKYSNQTGTSKDTETLIMQKGTNTITKECTGQIYKHADDCYNVKVASIFYSASGTIISN